MLVVLLNEEVGHQRSQDEARAPHTEHGPLSLHSFAYDTTNEGEFTTKRLENGTSVGEPIHSMQMGSEKQQETQANSTINKIPQNSKSPKQTGDGKKTRSCRTTCFAVTFS